MWITPYHQDLDFDWPLSLDDKITVFQESVYGWQLDIADKCINGSNEAGEVFRAIPHSAWAVLQMVFSYFEMIAKYRAGYCDSRQSEAYFIKGVHWVFPTLREQDSAMQKRCLKALYQGVRCGLYHSGKAGPNVVLTANLESALGFNPTERVLVINPHVLVPDLKRHLAEYVEQLRNPTNVPLRAKFERRWDYINSQGPYEYLLDESSLQPTQSGAHAPTNPTHDSSNKLFNSRNTVS